MFTINTKQMEFYGNDEGNDELHDSHANDDTGESDFDFDYNELVHNFDEFELLDKDTGWLKSFESKNERMCIF